MVLFYSASAEEDKPAFTAQFMPHFLRGYARHCRLAPRWLREIPHFMKIREIELFAVIHRDFDVETIDNPWIANFMRGRRERIEAGEPYIAFDFSALEPLLA
jgi:Ser/Thr protein kinase RdoA (MazF antagonist)